MRLQLRYSSCISSTYNSMFLRRADKTKGDKYPSTGDRRSRQLQERGLKHFNDDARYSDVTSACLRSGRPWEDPNFAASNRNLVSDDGGGGSIFTYAGGYGMSTSSIQWLRPKVGGCWLKSQKRICLCSTAFAIRCCFN